MFYGFRTQGTYLPPVAFQAVGSKDYTVWWQTMINLMPFGTSRVTGTIFTASDQYYTTVGCFFEYLTDIPYHLQNAPATSQAPVNNDQTKNVYTSRVSHKSNF